MLWFGLKKRVDEFDEKTQEGFSSVKKDMDSVGKWIKHLDTKNKQVLDTVFALRQDLSSVMSELESLREGIDLTLNSQQNKRVFKKLPVLDKQTGVQDVQKTVQTAVQTDNIHRILKGLSGNERLIVFTIMNSDMKLSYEDLALLLGKERSTVRGQINSIKQKSEGLIREITEKNGKKRVFVPEEIREKMAKYAKVRVESNKKSKNMWKR